MLALPSPNWTKLILGGVRQFLQSRRMNLVSIQYALHSMDPTPSPLPEARYSFGLDLTPSLLPEARHSFDLDLTPSPLPEGEYSFGLDLTPSPLPEAKRCFGMDLAPSPLPVGQHAFAFDLTPSPSSEAKRAFALDLTPSPEAQDAFGTQVPPLAELQAFGDSSEAHGKFDISHSYLHLSLVHAGWNWRLRAPSARSSEGTGQPNTAGEVKGMGELVCPANHIEV